MRSFCARQYQFSPLPDRIRKLFTTPSEDTVTSLQPQTFTPADIPVVILCGGMGTRLREASEKLPNPWSMSWQADPVARDEDLQPTSASVASCLCLGYKGDQIRRYFLDYREHSNDFTLELAAGHPPRWHGKAMAEDWEVTFVETGLLTGTGGRIRRVASHLDRDLFLMTYGDGVGSVDIGGLVEAHLAAGRLATVTGVHPASRYGEMHVDGSRVSEFNEKPTLATGWVARFFAFDRLG